MQKLFLITAGWGALALILQFGHRPIEELNAKKLPYSWCEQHKWTRHDIIPGVCLSPKNNVLENNLLEKYAISEKDIFRGHRVTWFEIGSYLVPVTPAFGGHRALGDPILTASLPLKRLVPVPDRCMPPSEMSADSLWMTYSRDTETACHRPYPDPAVCALFDQEAVVHACLSGVRGSIVGGRRHLAT